MAYKFQLGAARLSGSLVQEGTVTADASTISGSSVTVPNGGLSINGTAVTSTAAELNLLDGVSGLVQSDFTKLAAIDASAAEINVLDGLAQGRILVGDGDGAAAILDASTDGQILVGNGTTITSVAVSGDIGLANNGAMTIQANAVEGSMLNTNTVNSTSFQIASNEIQLKSGVNGDGLTLASHVLAVGAGDGITVNSADVAVTAAQTTITSVKNDALVVGRTSGNDHIDFSTGGTVAIETDNTARLSVTDTTSTFSNNVVIAGNLTVQGSSVEVQQGFVVTSSVQFEGSTPDGNEISLTSADPTADRTITLPDLSGHVPLIAGAIGNANVTAAEFLLLDGGTARGTTEVANGDGFLHNDGGTMRMTNVSKIADLFAGAGLVAVNSVMAVANATNGGLSVGANDMQLDLNDLAAASVAVANDSIAIIDADDNSTKKESIADLVAAMAGGGLSATSGVLSTSTNAVALIDNLGTGSTGVNYWADLAGNESMVLPNSPSVGDSIRIKAPSNCGTAGNITISPLNGSHSIDGASSIVLESPHAAVELVYVVSNLWKVF